MNTDFFSARVVCRPALRSDSAEVLEFTKFIWEGHDYIGYVWEEWLSDPAGLLAVAEYGGHAVGIAKVTQVSKGQWWLEGFRVDPKMQGLKIGSHIHEYVNTWWLEHGDGIVRLMTSSERVQVHHLCERLGYGKVGEVIGYSAAALDGGCESIKPLQTSEITAALDRAVKAATYRLDHNLVDTGWTMMALDRESLSGSIAQGRAWSWRGDQGLLLHWDDDDDEGHKVLGVGLPVCEIEALPDLLLDVRRLAALRGCASVFCIAFIQPQIQAALEQAGYTTSWDHTAFIYERRHPQTS